MPWPALPHALTTAFVVGVIAATAVPSDAQAAPETYRFDPVHSQVWFAADHQRFSTPQGRLRIKEGWFQFDPKDWTSARIDVVIDLASVDLGDAKWNAMVTSGQFLDAARWPSARYVSRAVEARDATHAIVHGELDFRGVKKPVDLSVTLNRVGNDPYLFKQKAGFSASATLDRLAFGMERYKEVVAATVELHFEIEGIRDRDAATDKPGEP
jgi:polyisoprenoid-binding protein YceI